MKFLLFVSPSFFIRFVFFSALFLLDLRCLLIVVCCACHLLLLLFVYELAVVVWVLRFISCAARNVSFVQFTQQPELEAMCPFSNILRH